MGPNTYNTVTSVIADIAVSYNRRKVRLAIARDVSYINSWLIIKLPGILRILWRICLGGFWTRRCKAREPNHR